VTKTKSPQTTNKNLQQYAWIIAAVMILLVFAFHLRGMSSMYMWADEHLSYENTQYPFTEALNRLFTANNHPPIWYTNFWFWRRLVGTHEILGRIQSILFSAITLSMVYQLGKLWFGKPRFGWYATAILGSSALFFIYSLEIRQYALTMLSVTLSMWLYTLWLKKQHWRFAVAYGASVAFMLYVHYFLLFAAVIQAIHFVVFELRTLEKFKQGLIAAGTAIIVWLPWVPILLMQLDFVRHDAEAKGRTGGLASTTYPTSSREVELLAEIASNGYVWLFGALFLIGVILLWRKSRYWLALFWVMAVPALVFLLNTQVRVYTPRYVAYICIGVALAAAATIASFPRYLRLIALVGLVGLNLYTLPDFIPVRAPERDILLDVSLQSTPDDAVYFTDGTPSSQVERYLTPELQANRIDTIADAKFAHRVWFITNDWTENADFRAQFEQLSETHALQTVLGQCTPAWCYLAQLLEAPPLESPVKFGDDILFWGGDIDQMTNTAIATRLWWRVRQTPDADYSIGLHLVASDGQIVAQNDGAIMDMYSNPAEVQTSQLEPDRTYIDLRDLPLPANLPAGEYQLAVVVYQWWDGIRLTTDDGDDAVILETVTIP
jgi:hypothetical protein